MDTFFSSLCAICCTRRYDLSCGILIYGYYGKRSGVALETQFFPDSVNHPEWAQPFVKANQVFETVTRYAFE